MDRTRLGVLRCGAAAVLFGATTPLAAEVADDTSAPMLAGLLYLGAALAVVPVVGRRSLDRAALRRAGPRLAAAVAAGGFLGPLLLAAGLARTTGATASLLLNLELAATTVLAAVFFGEHVGRRVVTGTVLVVVAGVVLAWSEAPELRLGSLLVVGACICWGLDNCVTADLDVIAPEQITLAKGIVAGGTNVVLGLVIGGQALTGWALPGALLIGALGYGVSITLWVAGAQDLGAARGQLVFSMAPFVGVAVAWVLLDEPISVVQVSALVLAGVGVLWVVGSHHEHLHAHQPIVHTHEHEHDEHHAHRHDEAVERAHRHEHAHEALVHAHPHVPDLHHRHEHTHD